MKYNCFHIKPFIQRTREFYTKENGLLSDTITSCQFDGDGNLYAGTDKGLLVFDGVSFNTFSYDGLDGEITFLYLDKSNTLWAGAGRTVFAVK